MPIMKRRAALLLAALMCSAGAIRAGEGPLGIDSELALDQSGIWQRKYSLALRDGVIVTEIAASVYLGNDDALGHTLWQTIDASVISGIGAAVLENTTGRPPPRQDSDPNVWPMMLDRRFFPIPTVQKPDHFLRRSQARASQHRKT